MKSLIVISASNKLSNDSLSQIMRGGKISTGVVMLFLVMISSVAFGQNRMTTSGDWTNNSNWNSGTHTNGITTSQLNNGVSASINDGENITSGSLTGGNNVTLQLIGTSTLDIGNASNALDLTTNNGTTISIGADGILTVWGDIIVNNNLILVVAGELIVKGNIQIKNGGALDISGSVTVDGNFVGGNNTEINIDGDMVVGGDFTVGNGSAVSGGGTISYGGSCSDSGSGVCSSEPLPINLAMFKVVAEGNEVILKWVTASEENNDYFTIERSRDGKEFEKVGTTTGAGTSTTVLNYSFTDPNPYYGRSYYRLSQTDFDGTSETFEIAAVTISSIKDITVFPNPVNRGKALRIETGADADEEVSIAIYNHAGKLIKADKLVGEQSIDIEDELEAGFYMLQVKSGQVSKSTRLVIQ
ncbi:T9SS type A sorting domain-containing protein [Fulvivirga imtechensis]|nr:T9SS type A sorting domain-containing protein [Fulvivirga imtechensis]